MTQTTLPRASIFDTSEAYRRTVLLGLFLFTAAFGLVFSALNYVNGNFVAVAAELGMAAFALSLIPVVRKTNRLLLWSFLYLVLFNSAMMLIISTPQVSNSVFAWVLLIPILSLMLLGRALGSAMTVVFLSIAFVLYYRRFGGDADYGTHASLLDVAGVALCIFGFSYAYETSRARAEEALKHRALTDPLTDLGNRAAFYQRFGAEIARFERHRTGYGIVLLDIDHFKAINDRYGHETGDEVLKRLSTILSQSAGRKGEAFRYGGEEFCVLLPEVSPVEAAGIAETLRKTIETAHLRHEGHRIAFTASIGVAAVPGDGTELRRILHVADERLYEAKARGRNAVVAG
ncbi:GGDEF domain-containing protein [Fulvimarina endophytica]|nr:GGDEF domain-containing protein [Fulvimarina endophytica]